MNWEMVEPGWYCAKGIGGICQEYTNKWHCYPKDEPNYKIPSKVSFKTLTEAKEWFNRYGRGN